MPSNRLTPERVRDIAECFGRGIDMRPISRKEIAELCRGYLAAADAETLAREAVREFAKDLASRLRNLTDDPAQQVSHWEVAAQFTEQLAAARGATLDEKH